MSAAGEGSPADVLEGRARWALVHGDCLEVLPTLPDTSIDHAVTDAPYSDWVHAQEKHAGPRRDGSRRLSVIDFDALTSEVLTGVTTQLGRLVRRWALCFSDAESNHLWREALEAAGMRHVRVGAWVKPDSTPQISGDRPAAAFETIEIAHRPGVCRWNGGGNRGVWEFGVVRADRMHSTPKPLDLMLRLVALFTDPEEVVLDPFAGSGTTGVACRALGRRFIGIEKDAKYAAIARDRIAGGPTTLERGGQRPLFGPESEDLFSVTQDVRR